MFDSGDSRIAATTRTDVRQSLVLGELLDRIVGVMSLDHVERVARLHEPSNEGREGSVGMCCACSNAIE